MWVFIAHLSWSSGSTTLSFECLPIFSPKFSLDVCFVRSIVWTFGGRTCFHAALFKVCSRQSRWSGVNIRKCSILKHSPIAPIPHQHAMCTSEKKYCRIASADHIFTRASCQIDAFNPAVIQLRWMHCKNKSNVISSFSYWNIFFFYKISTKN